MKLKSKLVLTFSSLIFVVLTIVSIISYTNIKNELQKSIKFEMISTVDGVSSLFNQWLLNKSKVIDTIKIVIDDVGVSGKAINYKNYLKASKRDKDLSNIYMGFSDGSYIEAGEWTAPPDYDPRKRPWYEKAVQNGTLTFTNPYTDSETNDLVVSAAIPLMDSPNNIKGVISEDITLNSIVDNISKIKIQGIGHAVLLDADGTIIYHPNTKLISKNASEDVELSNVASTMVKNNKGYLEFNANGKDNILVYKHFPATKWTLGVIVDKAAIFKHLYALRTRYILIDLIALGLSILFSLYIAKKLTSPLFSLVNDIDKTGNGDLTVKTTISTKDELSKLSLGFNTMVDNLRELVTENKDIIGEISVSSDFIKNSVNEISLSSDEVSKTIQDIAKGSSNQALQSSNNLETVSNLSQKLEGIIHKIKIVSEDALNIQDKNEMGIQSMEELNDKFGENSVASENATNYIEKLLDKSKSIDKIIQTIKSISEQTNLLSLNAAIEAARAGENGKGFSVVADEVRKLADQSSNSAKEIEFIIEEITHIIKETSKTVDTSKSISNSVDLYLDKTNNIFNEIKSSTNNFITQIKLLDTDVEIINKSKDDMITSTQHISSIAHESAACTEEISAAIEQQSGSIEEIEKSIANLTNMIDTLSNSIQKFKI